MTAGRAQSRPAVARALARVLAAVILLVASSVYAGDARRPFDRVDAGVHATGDAGGNDFHAYWRAGTGVSLDAVVPFYAGSVSLLARFIHNDALNDAATPSMYAWGLWGGWWLGSDLAGTVRLSVGASLGVTQWHFSSEANTALRRELELGTAAAARVAWEFTPRWSVALTGEIQRTYTHERIDLAFVSAGLVRSFDAPDWVRGVLR